MRETSVWSLGWEDPLEKAMATHSSILAWENPMDRGAWRTVHGVTKSQTRLSDNTTWLGKWRIYYCDSVLHLRSKKQEVLPGLVGTENRKRHVWEPRQLILDVLCPLEPKNYELLLPCLFRPHFFFFFLQTSFPCLSASLLLPWVYTSSVPIVCARGSGTNDRDPQKVCGLLTEEGEAGQHDHFSRLLKIWWMTEHLSPIFSHFLKQSKLSKH